MSSTIIYFIVSSTICETKIDLLTFIITEIEKKTFNKYPDKYFHYLRW